MDTFLYDVESKLNINDCDITDIRMIASGSGYTTLPTATIDGVRHIGLETTTSSEVADFSRVELEQGGRIVNESSFAVLNVQGATVIPYGDDIGRATPLSIIEHGVDYTSAPTLATKVTSPFNRAAATA